MEEITVILADDNRHMRKSLTVVLAPVDNIRVIGEATNGEEAIALVNELRPTVVLLDINMSPVNGFEAAEQIIARFPQTKVIALSLHKQVSYCRNMFRIGASGYVTKSSPYQDIIAAINKVASGGKFVDRTIDFEV
jgi:two-component system invasion response regulator UvrY